MMLRDQDLSQEAYKVETTSIQRWLRWIDVVSWLWIVVDTTQSWNNVDSTSLRWINVEVTFFLDVESTFQCCVPAEFTITRILDSQGRKMFSCGQRRLWSDRANAQADSGLRWAHVLWYVFSSCSYMWQNTYSVIASGLPRILSLVWISAMTWEKYLMTLYDLMAFWLTWQGTL